MVGLTISVWLRISAGMRFVIYIGLRVYLVVGLINSVVVLRAGIYCFGFACLLLLLVCCYVCLIVCLRFGVDLFVIGVLVCS